MGDAARHAVDIWGDFANAHRPESLDAGRWKGRCEVPHTCCNVLSAALFGLLAPRISVLTGIVNCSVIGKTPPGGNRNVVTGVRALALGIEVVCVFWGLLRVATVRVSAPGKG